MVGVGGKSVGAMARATADVSGWNISGFGYCLEWLQCILGMDNDAACVVVVGVNLPGILVSGWNGACPDELVHGEWVVDLVAGYLEYT